MALGTETPQARGRRMMSEAGYKGGGDIKRVARKAVREHETAQHKGKHEALKLKRGGGVHGAAAEARPDRRARGGETMAGGKGKPKVGAVNIRVGGAGDGQQQAQQALQVGRQQGMAIGARMGAAQAARPAGPPPGAGMAPPGAGGPPGMPPGAGGAPPGARPPGMMKRGGAMKRARGGELPRDDNERRKPAAGYEPIPRKGVLKIARGGDVPDDDERKPKGADKFEPPEDTYDERKRGGHVRRAAGGDLTKPQNEGYRPESRSGESEGVSQRVMFNDAREVVAPRSDGEPKRGRQASAEYVGHNSEGPSKRRDPEGTFDDAREGVDFGARGNGDREPASAKGRMTEFSRRKSGGRA